MRLDRMKAISPRPVLLHRDYKPRNLILMPDGNIVTLDPEWLSFGDFYADLPIALFKFCFAARSDELTTVGPLQLMESGRFDHVMDAYFSCAQPDGAAIADEHLSTIIFWGYLRMTRLLAERLHVHTLKGRVSRRRVKRQVEQHWEHIVRFAENSG